MDDKYILVGLMICLVLLVGCELDEKHGGTRKDVVRSDRKDFQDSIFPLSAFEPLKTYYIDCIDGAVKECPEDSMKSFVEVDCTDSKDPYYEHCF